MRSILKGGIGALFIVALGMGWWSEVFAIEIVAPIEGARLPLGSSYLIQIKPSPGEDWRGVADVMNVYQFNAKTGMFELDNQIPLDSHIGLITIDAWATDQNGKSVKLTRKVEYVLPSTTVVTGISASFNGEKIDFAQIARKPNGDLVGLGGISEGEISIGATYSDGVARDMASNPDVTYKSLDEKVAIVIPPGQWKDSKGNVVKSYALVRATGPGKADIVVQYGEFTDRVTLKVRECPYVEGKMENGCLR